jgi:hypothetical protein
MPSARQPSDVENCAAAVRAMPRLVELEVARGYPDGAAYDAQLAVLAHVRMPSWSFPWPRKPNHLDKLMFVIETTAHEVATGKLVDRYGLEHAIPVQSLVSSLERDAETFDATTRAGWTRQWTETREFVREEVDAATASLAGRLRPELGVAAIEPRTPSQLGSRPREGDHANVRDHELGVLSPKNARAVAVVAVPISASVLPVARAIALTTSGR